MNKELHQKFLQLFSDIQFEVQLRTERKYTSIETVLTTEKQLRRALQAAKTDFSRAKKLHKAGKMSTEELFDWEWRVHELEEEIRRMQEEIEDLSGDLDDLEEI